MTTWRYVTTLTRTEHGDMYEVREVYTGDDGSLSWTTNPIAPQGDTWLELLDCMAVMGRDAAGPKVLDITDPANPTWCDHKGRALDTDRSET